MQSTDFEAFLEERAKAAAAFVKGDGGPVGRLVTHDGVASFHGPGGDTVSGAPAVAARYLADAKAFRPNGTSRFEVVQKGSDGELGFWTGFQIARAQIGDMPAPAEMRLRVTEVYRKIGASGG